MSRLTTRLPFPSATHPFRPRRQLTHTPFLRTLTTDRPPYVPPQSTLTPYTPPSSTFSSSGVPSMAHPMPSSMPREDYAEPLAYTTSLVGKVIKYLFVGIFGLSGAALISLEGGHQYIEHIALKPPPRPSTSDAVYAWESEADSWTGDLTNGGGGGGGTSPLLGWWIRHLMRSAWVCQELGSGNSPVSIGSEAELSNVSVKGMISTGKSSNIRGGGFVNRVDKGYEMAESYISEAIKLAEQKRLVVIPPPLSVTRELVPSTSSDINMRKLTEAERVGVELSIRHADVLERMGTRGTLNRSQEIYERVIRFSLSTNSDSEAEKRTNGSNKAKILRLAKKIGDINARLGEDTRANAWWKWGMEGCGFDIGPSVGSHLETTMVPPSSSMGKAGWFSGWISASTPTKSMRQTLAVNAIPSHQTTSTLPTPNPPTFRALISLISSYSAHLAKSGDLYSAEVYEQAQLDLLRSSAASDAQPEDQSPAARLQSLWIKQRSSLAQLHLAEIRFARVGDFTEGLRCLSQAVLEAEDTVARLTGGPTIRTTKDVLYPNDAPPVSALTLTSSFNGASRRSWLTKPAQSLLKDSQRSAAQGWYLSGVLYERSTRRVRVHSSLPAKRRTDETREVEELALDCYDRAIQWHRVAMGGQPGEDEDNLPASAYNADPASGGERALYWSAFARMRQRLEDEVAVDLKQL